jgi:hypothetical protein
VKEIPLSQGKVAIVDDEDYAELAQYKWCIRKTGGGQSICAIRNAPTPVTSGPKQIQMHRQIMQAPDGIEVDHANGDPLDNRRCNLRLATRSQNLANRRTFSSTGFKGVHRYSNDGSRFIMQFAQVYNTAEEAARAYDRIAKIVHGDFARLNFPEAQ